MDHIEVLREKIGRLRVEIAQIQVLNKQYRLRDWTDAEAQVAHGQRHERLQAIQEELAQLTSLGRKPQLVKQMTTKHGSRLHLVKKGFVAQSNPSLSSPRSKHRNPKQLRRRTAS